MKALWFSGLLAVSVLAGCGNSIPVIDSPAQGAQYSISKTTTIDVTIQNQNYQNVTIQFLGTEAVPDFQWLPSANAPARAYKQQNTGGFSNCTAQRPCTVFIIATRGDQKDFRSISLIP